MLAVTIYGYAIGAGLLAVAIVVGALAGKVEGITKWGLRVKVLGLESDVEAGGSEIKTVGDLVETVNRALALAKSADERSERTEQAMKDQQAAHEVANTEREARHANELAALHRKVELLEEALTHSNGRNTLLEAELATARARIAELEG